MSIRFYQPSNQLTPRIETKSAVTNLNTVKMFEPYIPSDDLDVEASAICNIPIVETPSANLDFLVYRESVKGAAWTPFAPGPDGMTGMTGPGGVTGPAANSFNFNVETVTPALPTTYINPDVAVSFLDAPGADLSLPANFDGQIKIIVNLSSALPVPVTGTNLFIYNGLNYSLLQFNAVGSTAKLLWSSYLGNWIILARNNVSIA